LIYCQNEKLSDIVLQKQEYIRIKYATGSKKEIREFILDNNLINEYLKRYDEKFSIEKLLKYYLSIKDNVEVVRIEKLVRKEYKMEDFLIKEKQKRKYGNGTIIYVNIRNVVTGRELEDWIKPKQIKNLKELNNLTYWENKGEVIFET